MFGGDYLENNEDFFITNADNSNRIKTISSQSEYLINFKFDGISTKKKCLICVEKIDKKELIQLRVTELDYRKIYISTINIEYFDVLKLNQSLHVTFSGFMENLLKFLKECHNGNLQINLLRDKNNDMFLQFYEAHAFKNLVHLSLPTEEASLQVVNFHLHQITHKLQKHNVALDSTINDLKRDLNNAYEEISQLKKNNLKFREDISEQKHIFLKRRKDELNEMQENIKKLTESKELDEIQYKKNIVQLQKQFDTLTLEKSNAIKEKVIENKKYEAIRKENISLKSNITNLKQKNEQLSHEISSFRNQEHQYKTENNNLNKLLSDMNEKNKKLHKTNSELEAELEAEKQICKTKRNALSLATEEISKANQIISKQSLEIEKHKKTIDWRTEVALQQEKAIKEKDKQICNLNNKVLNVHDELENLRKETVDFPKQLTSIKELTDAIESKYNKKIADLKKSIKF